MKYVPELEEERFQSMVAVPVLDRGGEVIGVIVLHTQAPREFDDDVVNFLVHTASLVAGAIENAQLYGDARRRVEALTTLTELSQALASVTLREELYERSRRGARAAAARRPLPGLAPRPRGPGAGAGGQRPAGGARGRARRVPLGADARLHAQRAARRRACRGGGGRTAAGGAARRRRRAARRRSAAWCAARDFAAEDAELLRAVANQTAVGLKKAELIERLTAENIVKDMFEALAAGSVAAAEAKAVEARCDLQPPARVPARRARPGQRRRTALAGPGGAPAEPAAAPLPPRVLRRPSRQPARAGAAARRDRDAARAAIGGACDALAREHGLLIGLSGADRARPGRGGACARRPTPPGSPARLPPRAGRSPTTSSAPTATSSTSSSTRRPTTATARRCEALLEYDERRNAQLVETLERFLALALERHGERAGALHPPEHRAPAPRPHRADHRARAARRGPAVARAGPQGRPPAPREGALGAMLLFLLTGRRPADPARWASLILCYLTGWDMLRTRQDLPFLIKAWWVLLVFITNLIGVRQRLRIWLGGPAARPPRGLRPA